MKAYHVQVRRPEAAILKGRQRVHASIVWSRWKTVESWPADTDPERVVRSLQYQIAGGTLRLGRVHVGTETLVWGDHRGVWVVEGTPFAESIAHLIEKAGAA